MIRIPHHLRPTRIVFLSQFFKWFAYYGVISLLTSFLVKGLHYTESQTITFISTYLTFVNLFIFIGSIVADKYLGIRRSFLLGNIFYCLAFIFLFILSCYPDLPQTFIYTLTVFLFVFLSLAGTTLNSTSSVLLTKTHQSNNNTSGLDISYSYNYFFSSLGSVLGKILFPLLIGTSFGLLWGYRFAFLIAVLLTFLAVINILWNYKKLDRSTSLIDQQILGKKVFYLFLYFIILFFINMYSFKLEQTLVQLLSYFIVLIAIIYFVIIIIRVDKAYTVRMILALVICLQMTVFFIYRNQIFTSLLLYPMHIMRPLHIGHFIIGGEMTLAFNALWGVLGTPCIIGILSLLNRQGKKIDIGYKFVIGFLLTAVSYGIFWYSCLYAIHTHSQDISILWFLVGHLFVALAEILIMNLVLSSLSLLVPAHLTATTLGLHYMTMGVGAILAGKLASHIALDSHKIYSSLEIFTLYAPFFKNLMFIALGFCCLFFMSAWLIRSIVKKYEISI